MKPVHASRSQAHPHPKPEWFSGRVQVQDLNPAQETQELEVLVVFFEAGARTKPHTHSTDQLLFFLEGEGVVATKETRRLFRDSGMAIVPAGEWHWHGATPNSPTSHLSIRPGGPSAWPPEVPMLDWETYMTGVRETD